MSISIDQSLEVFRDSFHSFYIIGIQIVKINVFFCEKIFLDAFLSYRSACVYEQVQVT